YVKKLIKKKSLIKGLLISMSCNKGVKSQQADPKAKGLTRNLRFTAFPQMLCVSHIRKML
ncbi:unnamed protein product, partial [marine sediment metagenome]